MTVSERSRMPDRPHGVPEAAEWHPQLGEWLSGSRDNQGRWQGEVVGYRADGTRASLQTYREGELDGAQLRYHPNGEVAREARYVRGKPEGELRATASSAPSPERLRSCCVPGNAWSLVARYERGQLLDEWFENDQGQRLLSDGSVRPERPPSVPAHARFDETSRRWYEGETQLKRGRQGHWRWWAEAGALIEECRFEAGQLSGPATRKQVAPGIFEEVAISAWSGHFDAGMRSGHWKFLAADGTPVRELDFGTPLTALDVEHPIFAEQVSDPEALSRQLLGAGDLGLALCALARRAQPNADFTLLHEALQEHTVPLTRAASQRRVAELKRSKQHTLAVWVRALLDGVEPSVVLANLAMLLLVRPKVGLDFAEAAVSLQPQQHRFRLTRALLAFEAGDPEKAFAEAETLDAPEPAAARLIRDYRRILFTTPDFVPAGYAAETPANPELPEGVNQPLSEVQHAIEKYAFRLTKVRERLSEMYGDQVDWLPADVTGLYDGAGVNLESYSFEEHDDEEGVEVIRVDETLELEGLGTTALLRRARVEWVGLCWLCWGAGLSQVARPERLGECADFAAVLASSLFRVFRVSDSLQTRGLRSKSQGLPSTRWEGSDVDTLDPLFAGMARDEAFEMRAALFFLADDRCRSPWQDDLREV